MADIINVIDEARKKRIRFYLNVKRLSPEQKAQTQSRLISYFPKDFHYSINKAINLNQIFLVDFGKEKTIKALGKVKEEKPPEIAKPAKPPETKPTMPLPEVSKEAVKAAIYTALKPAGVNLRQTMYLSKLPAIGYGGLLNIVRESLITSPSRGLQKAAKDIRERKTLGEVMTALYEDPKTKDVWKNVALNLAKDLPAASADLLLNPVFWAMGYGIGAVKKGAVEAIKIAIKSGRFTGRSLRVLQEMVAPRKGVLLRKIPPEAAVRRLTASDKIARTFKGNNAKLLFKKLDVSLKQPWRKGAWRITPVGKSQLASETGQRLLSNLATGKMTGEDYNLLHSLYKTGQIETKWTLGGIGRSAREIRLILDKPPEAIKRGKFFEILKEKTDDILVKAHPGKIKLSDKAIAKLKLPENLKALDLLSKGNFASPLVNILLDKLDNLFSSGDIKTEEEVRVPPPEIKAPRVTAPTKKGFLDMVDKAIEEAPDVEAIDEAAPRKTFNIQGVRYNIYNTKEALKSFKEIAKKYPEKVTAGVTPAPPTIRKTGYASREVFNTEALSYDGTWLTDRETIIQAPTITPDIKRKLDKSAATPVDLKIIHKLLGQPTQPAELVHYFADAPEMKGASTKPIIPTTLPVEDAMNYVLFRKQDGSYSVYNQFKLNAITKRFPDATFGMSENNALIAYDEGVPIGGISPIVKYFNKHILTEEEIKTLPSLETPTIQEEDTELLSEKLTHLEKVPTTMNPSTREVFEITTPADFQRFISSKIKNPEAVTQFLGELAAKIGVPVRVRPKILRAARPAFGRYYHPPGYKEISIAFANDIITFSHEFWHGAHDYLFKLSNIFKALGLRGETEKIARQELINVGSIVRPEYYRGFIEKGRSPNHKELFADYMTVYSYTVVLANKVAPVFTGAFRQYLLTDAGSRFAKMVWDVRDISSNVVPPDIIEGKKILDDVMSEQTPYLAKIYDIESGQFKRWAKNIGNILNEPLNRARFDPDFYPAFRKWMNTLYEGNLNRWLVEGEINWEVLVDGMKNKAIKDRVSKVYWDESISKYPYSIRSIEEQLKLEKWYPAEITQILAVLDELQNIHKLSIEYYKLYARDRYLRDRTPEEQEAGLAEIDELANKNPFWISYQRFGEWNVFGETYTVERGKKIREIYFYGWDKHKDAVDDSKLLKQYGYENIRVYNKKEIDLNFFKKNQPGLSVYVLENMLDSFIGDPRFKDKKRDLRYLKEELRKSTARNIRRYFLKRKYVAGIRYGYERLVETQLKFLEDSIRSYVKSKGWRAITDEKGRLLREGKLDTVAFIQNWEDTLRANIINSTMDSMMREFVYAWYLIARPMITIMDLASIPVVIEPLASKYIPLTIMPTMATKAVRSLIKRKDMPPELKLEFSKAKAEGYTGAPFLEEITRHRKTFLEMWRDSVDETFRKDTLAYAYHTAKNVATSGLQFWLRFGEIVKREYAFLLAYHIHKHLRDTGKIHKLVKQYPELSNLQDFTRTFVEETTTIYQSANLPAFVEKSGELRWFAQNAMLLARYVYSTFLQFNRILLSDTKKYPVTTKVFRGFAQLGASGARGIFPINWLLAVLSILGVAHIYSIKRRAKQLLEKAGFNSKTAEKTVAFLEGGIPNAFLNVSLYGQLGLDPFYYPYSVWDIAAKGYYHIGRNFAEGVKRFRHGDPPEDWLGLMTPLSIFNLIRARQMMTTGLKNYNKKLLMRAEDITKYDVIWRGIGAWTGRLRGLLDKESFKAFLNKVSRKNKTYLADKVANKVMEQTVLIKKGDKESMQKHAELQKEIIKITEQIKKFNAKIISLGELLPLEERMLIDSLVIKDFSILVDNRIIKWSGLEIPRKPEEE